MEKRKKGTQGGFTSLLNREIGLCQSRCFTGRLSASEELIKRLNLYGILNGHNGCVNDVAFNSTGDLLLSGSDDREVMFWDWASKNKTFSYPSGHFENIFQTRTMPFTDDRRIVTSSADGQVRVGEILENGQVDTKMLGKHEGRVHKLALEPGNPHIFYSCGEDGLVQHFDLRSSSSVRLFNCSSFIKNSRQHPDSISLNTIVIDPMNPIYFAIGGSDVYARVYDIRRCQLDASSDSDKPVNIFCPRHLIKTNKTIQITGLAYSKASELLVSYNDELIYLFQKSMGLATFPSSLGSDVLLKLEEAGVYMGHRNSKTIKGVSFFGTKDEYVMSGSDCGHIFIWKKKGAKLVRLMVGDRQVVNHLEPHPYMPFIASCGIENNVKLWTPMPSEAPAVPYNVEKILESNRQRRVDHWQVSYSPDVIMHALRLHRRQAIPIVESRYNRSDLESDEEEDYVSQLLHDVALSEEGSVESSGECTIC